MFRKTPPARPSNGHSGNGANGTGLSPAAGSGQAHSKGRAPANGKNGHLPTLKGLSANGKIETVIGANAAFNGTFSARGGVRIDGGFDGAIEVAGPLVIGEGAKVVAEIKAQAVSVGGMVKGNIAADKVEILSTGRVYGDLNVAVFSTEEGAYLRGQIRMLEEEAAPEAEALPAS